MKIVRRTIPAGKWLLVIAGIMAWMQATVYDANGQFERRWLNAGQFHHVYTASGGEPAIHFPEQKLMMWPGVHPDKALGIGFSDWFSVRNWTDPSGQTWSVQNVHNGPEAPGVGEVFPAELEVISRFEATDVVVDGLESLGRFVVIDAIDESMNADRMIRNVFHTHIGLTVERNIMQFSNEYHDNYHVLEFTLTNTGINNEEGTVQLEGQTLEDLYFFPNQHYADVETSKAGDWGGVWGRNNMNDVVGDGMEDYDTDFRASFSWQGFTPRVGGHNTLGGPIFFDNEAVIFSGDTLGRLSSAYHVGRVTIHADTSPQDRSDDRSQPSTNTYFDWDHQDLRAPNYMDEVHMTQVRNNWIEAGQTYPHHADLVTGVTGPYDRDRFANQTTDPGLGLTGGYTQAQGYGPYTLEFGESINFVIAQGVAGLSNEAAFEIGRAYKRAWEDGDDFRPIEYNGESMSKQHWVMTARDSIFQMFERAIANHDSQYELPSPPKPPRVFEITSGVDQVELAWELHPNESPSGIEIYRGRFTPLGDPASGYVYEKIADLGPTEREYFDTEVTRGVDYYYYLQVVGDPISGDPTGTIPEGTVLKSNRYYTQTYDPAILKREPGQDLEAARVVPNPFYLGSSSDVRWPDKDYRVAFLNIPGHCRIDIYTELGELVHSIDHTDGSGDAFWDLATASNQLVVSGVYPTVITDLDTGEQIIRKIVVVR